jgi:hypothetical protein
VNRVKGACDLKSFEMHMLLFKLISPSFDELEYGISRLIVQTQVNEPLCFKVVKKPNKIGMAVILEDANLCIDLLDLQRIYFFINFNNSLFDRLLMLSNNDMFDCIYRHLIPKSEFVVKLSILGPDGSHSVLSH